MEKDEMKGYRALNDEEIKMELTKMLSDVDEFMTENNYHYTITAGTLLGAVRHEGFIPWDDDIDIAMLRPEYEMLLEQLKKNPNINEDLIADGFEIGKGDFPYIKILNRRIPTEEYISPYCNLKGYLWIDVFPFDGAPDTQIDDYYTNLKNLESKYYLTRIYKRKWLMRDPKEITFIYKLKSHLKYGFVNYDSLIKEFIDFSKKYKVDMNKKVANNIWGVGYQEAFPAEYMNEFVDYKFENIKVKGIKEADKWLTTRYGDYMKLPPVEERVNHGLKAWKAIEK